MTDRRDDLLAALHARAAAGDGPAELASFLAAEGLDEGAIGAMLRLLAGEADPAKMSGRRPRRRSAATDGTTAVLMAPAAPIRVPGPHEWGRFTPEAWGRVLQIAAGGFLATPDLERVLDQALDHGGGRVDLPVLRAVLDGVGLAEVGADGDPTTIH